MRLLTAIFLLVYSNVLAQQAEPLLFKEKTHDFGEIAEEGGNAEYEFSFTNNSGRAIKIITVQASCGCTTPGWSKDPVPHGKVGFIKASFDPKGRPGYFNKSLTVTTDLEGGPVVLQIKGQVTSRTKVVAAADFPIERGSLRFKSNSFNMDKIFINRAGFPREFPVYNAGDKSVRFAGIVGPAYIKTETPHELGAHERGTIKITYDAKLRGQYGFTSDNIEIGTNDDLQPVKSFSVYATIEEFFPNLSAEELKKAPVFQLENSEIDLGRMHSGTSMARELEIKNSGKKDLVIRAIQENCSCVTASLEPMRIKAGEGGKVKISFNPQGRSGMQQKAVTIYSNDPRNPVQRITLTANVEN